MKSGWPKVRPDIQTWALQRVETLDHSWEAELSSERFLLFAIEPPVVAQIQRRVWFLREGLRKSERSM